MRYEKTIRLITSRVHSSWVEEYCGINHEDKWNTRYIASHLFPYSIYSCIDRLCSVNRHIFMSYVEDSNRLLCEIETSILDRHSGCLLGSRNISNKRPLYECINGIDNMYSMNKRFSIYELDEYVPGHIGYSLLKHYLDTVSTEIGMISRYFVNKSIGEMQPRVIGASEKHNSALKAYIYSASTRSINDIRQE